MKTETNKITEKQLLQELERVSRIIAYSAVENGKDLDFCRKALLPPLKMLEEMRQKKESDAVEKALKKAEMKNRKWKRGA